MSDTPANPASPADRRIAPRRQPAMGTVCRFSGTEVKPAMGLIWNISTSGISMLLHTPFEVKAVVSGTLETMDGRYTQPITFQVVHVKQLETGDYFMGGHFQRALTPEEMDPFVS